MKTHTHWKKLTNPNYIGSYSLEPGEERIVKIKKVSKEMVMGGDGKKEECIVAQLEGEKPLILNKTNCKIIAKVYDTPYIEDWAGKPITLYVTKVSAFGQEVEALRIRQRRPEPAAKPEFDPKHPKWNDAIRAAKSGALRPEQIKSNYSITEANLKTLFDETVQD
ncbi:MAG: hypothetical protein ACLFQA_00280 [Bacteroidales bacterium]